jgi:hypothetical protein
MLSLLSFVLLIHCTYSLRVLLEEEAKIPSSWVKQERVDGDATLILTFALRQTNLKALNDLFWKVTGMFFENSLRFNSE